MFIQCKVMDKKSKNIFFSLFTATSNCSAQAMAIRIPLLPLPCYTLQGSFSFLGGLILSLNLSLLLSLPYSLPPSLSLPLSLHPLDISTKNNVVSLMYPLSSLKHY